MSKKTAFPANGEDSPVSVQVESDGSIRVDVDSLVRNKTYQETMKTMGDFWKAYRKNQLKG